MRVAFDARSLLSCAEEIDHVGEYLGIIRRLVFAFGNAVCPILDTACHRRGSFVIFVLHFESTPNKHSREVRDYGNFGV